MLQVVLSQDVPLWWYFIGGLVSSLSHGLGVLAHCSDGFCVHKTGKCGFSCFPDTSTTRENINLKIFWGACPCNQCALHTCPSAHPISYCFLCHCYQTVTLGTWELINLNTITALVYLLHKPFFCPSICTSGSSTGFKPGRTPYSPSRYAGQFCFTVIFKPL